MAALSAFPNARRCAIRLEAEHSSKRQFLASQSRGNSAQSASLPESELLLDALTGLHGRDITALAVTGLSSVVPGPDSECWGPLLESVCELELGDVSHAVAADQGAFNTLLHGQHLRARSDALVRDCACIPLRGGNI